MFRFSVVSKVAGCKNRRLKIKRCQKRGSLSLDLHSPWEDPWLLHTYGGKCRGLVSFCLLHEYLCASITLGTHLGRSPGLGGDSVHFLLAPPQAHWHLAPGSPDFSCLPGTQAAVIGQSPRLLRRGSRLRAASARVSLAHNGCTFMFASAGSGSGETSSLEAPSVKSLTASFPSSIPHWCAHSWLLGLSSHSGVPHATKICQASLGW